MNISKDEQRVLHVLSQGGEIRHERGANGKIERVRCFTHDGNVLSNCTLALFSRLRRRGLIRSTGGKPYRASQLGRSVVRAQLDNRT
ncbi:YjhX family toxin [Pontivivens insulae]|uniref:UPF0386 protein POI8812_00447 n=1 Tax=Pontivivens insulae TaxID=1639689 RepID=A0A2R8A7E1_9RHOB|nr:YjhX family toxin [Pontivivens insulae]RED18251.1 hypothetical protein DFR53_0446 [Pontivivens insulae]SPF28149.1 hypothetical protein POI8812_00447 [Pontivivens insulae]